MAKPIRTPDTNLVYKLPGGTEDNDLPCVREVVGGTPVICSTWQLDTDELVRVTETGCVDLAIWGEPIPPVNIAQPGKLHEVQDVPIARAHLERAIHLLVRVLEDQGDSVSPAEDVLAGLDQCLLRTVVTHEEEE